MKNRILWFFIGLLIGILSGVGGYAHPHEEDDDSDTPADVMREIRERNREDRERIAAEEERKANLEEMNYLRVKQSREDADRGIERGYDPSKAEIHNPKPGTPWYNPSTDEYSPPESEGEKEGGLLDIYRCPSRKKSINHDDDTPVDHHKMSPKKINKTFPKSKTKKPKLIKKFE